MSNPVLDYVLQHSTATGNDRMVLMLIAMRADYATGIGFPGNALLAKEGNISPRTVIRCIQSLIDAKELRLIEGGVGRGKLRHLQIVGYAKGDNLTPYEAKKGDKPDAEKVTESPEKVTNRAIKGDKSRDIELNKEHTGTIEGEPRARAPEPVPPPQPMPAPSDIPDLLGNRPRQLPRQARQLQETAAKMQQIGVSPETYREMTDAILEIHGLKALADEAGDDKALRDAQDCARALATMEFKSVADIERILKSWRQYDWRGDSPPTYRQLIEHASMVRSGKVVNTRKPEPGQTVAKPDFGTRRKEPEAEHKAIQLPALTPEDLAARMERIRAEGSPIPKFVKSDDTRADRLRRLTNVH